MPGLDIIDRLKLLARGDNLDLADIVCGDAVAEVKRLRKALKEVKARTYSTDRRCRLEYEPVAEICDIATSALSSTERS